MNKIKVKVDTKPLISGDVVRGVGFYTSQLISHLEKLKEIELVEKDFDIIHYPYFNPFFLTLPVNNNVKTIVTIHDLIPLIYPKQYPSGLKGAIRYRIQKNAVKKADAIITVSETSKKDIVRFLGIPAEKIFVTYEAAGEMFRKLEVGSWMSDVVKRYGLPERFVLYVGDINYNKNIPALVEACKIINTPLVIVGKQAADLEKMSLIHPELSHLLTHKSLILSHSLRLGYVPDEDLVKIINLATVYCQPSFYEGFGLPVVQAFACGVPVVASKTQALVEIGDDAAIFVDPGNPKDIAAGIKRVIENRNLREELIEKGLRRIKDFSWDKTAKETVKVYRKVVGE
ncbi:glycosyltransferase family 4 protein [Patescibacteria group bacterium]|nr:glycosyltransferase family 4 protein [Patescibacteria group bacterium]